MVIKLIMLVNQLVQSHIDISKKDSCKNIVGPPMAGFIVDYSGDLNLAFYISAGKGPVQ